MTTHLLQDNPLLHFTGLHKVDQVKAEHVSPAIDHLLTEARKTVATLSQDSASNVTWENFAAQLEDMEEKLARAWSQVGHMNAVVNSPELRAAYNDNLSKLTDFYADLGQDERLYAKFRSLRASPEFDALPPTQKKIVENELRDFRLGGAELSNAKKVRFKEIQEQLSKLSAKFEENVLDNTNDYSLYVEDEDTLGGIPDDVLQTAKEAAVEEHKSGWKFTLHSPSYFPVLQYGQNRELRATLYRAYATRASEFGKPEWDNTPLIKDILKLRLEAANLLGFENYAELSLATKMAESPQHVSDFLQDLAVKAKPYALKDKAELEQYAAKLGITDMQAWDVAYVSEKLREDKYAFSDLEIKQYFPEAKVLDGLFKVVESIFGIQVSPSQASLWHDTASFYDIKDQNNQLIGQFYLDLYARNNKRGGAWMDEAITRRKVSGVITTPVAFSE